MMLMMMMEKALRWATPQNLQKEEEVVASHDAVLAPRPSRAP